MLNERQLMPLREYNVRDLNGSVNDTFTADFMKREGGDIQFYNSGNMIRMYADAPQLVITATPVVE